MRSRRSIGALAFALLISVGVGPDAATAQRAQSGVEAPHSHSPMEHIVSLDPFAFFARGVSLSYEHFTLPPHLSLRGTLGFSASGQSDFRSRRFAGAVEARYFFFGRGPFHDFGGREMVGLFAGVRFSTTHTALIDRIDDRRAGRSWTFIALATLGYRFSLGPSALITGTLGAGMATDKVPNWKAMSRATVSTSISLGVLFGE